MAVFWVVAPCSLVEVYQRFRGAFCLHHPGDHRPDVREERKELVRFQVLTAVVVIIALMMEAASTSETMVNFYRTTRRNTLEDSRLQRA
jgi:hypothetical protein